MYLVTHILRSKKGNYLRYVYMSNLLLRYPLYVFGHAYIEIEERELFKICVYVNLLLRCPLYIFGHAYIEIEERELFDMCICPIYC